jgi:plasmid stability protein
MTSVQIRDAPEETHRVLRRRAAEAHQSLQEYLRSRLDVPLITADGRLGKTPRVRCHLEGLA